MLAVNAQLFSSVQGLLSHRSTPADPAAIPDLPTEVRARTGFGSMLMDLLSKTAPAAPTPTTDAEQGSGRWSESETKRGAAGKRDEEEMPTKAKEEIQDSIAPAEPRSPTPSLLALARSASTAENQAVSPHGVSNYSPSALASPTSQPPPRPVSPSVSLSVSPERAELEMDLDAPDLGPLRLRVSIEDNRVSVHMLVRSDQVRRRLEEYVGLLRARFAELEVELTHFDVERDTSGNSHESEPEDAADPSQSETNGLPNLRKTLAYVTHPRTLVDIIT